MIFQEQELKEKVQKHLLKLQNEQPPSRIDEDEEDFTFELRKNTLRQPVTEAIIKSNINSNSPDHTSGNLAAMPRAIMLSNTQLQQQLEARKPKLYDEDDNYTESPIGTIEDKEKSQDSHQVSSPPAVADDQSNQSKAEDEKSIKSETLEKPSSPSVYKDESQGILSENDNSTVKEEEETTDINIENNMNDESGEIKNDSHTENSVNSIQE